MTLAPGTKLYYVNYDGTLETAEFVEENYAQGATLPSWIVRKHRVQQWEKIRVSKNSFYLTKSEAYANYIHELETGLVSTNKQIRELEQLQKTATLQLAETQKLLRVIRIEENQ